MKKLFSYGTACVPLPRTPKLDAFIEKWNRHEGAEKYRHDGVNLHVYDQIFKRVEKWENGEQRFDYEQQELIDCFDHAEREADVRQLAEKGEKLADRIAALKGVPWEWDCFFCKPLKEL